MKPGFPLLRPAVLTGVKGLALTLAATSAAALVSLVAAPLTHQFPFSLFFLAVALSTWFGGFRQGLLSLALALFGVNFLLQPLWGTSQGLLRAGLWLVFGGSVAFMVGKLASFQGRAHAVLANIAEGVVILDRGWKIVFINRYGAPCADLPLREMIGRNYWEVAPEAAGTVFEQHVRRCAAERMPVQFEIRTPRRQRWLQVRAYPLPDGVCVFSEDITETKQRESRLRAVLERLATAHKAAQMGTWEWNFRTNEMFWSEELPGIHAIPVEQYDGKLTTWLKTVHPDDVAGIRAGLRDALSGKEEYYAEFRVVRPSGEVRSVCCHGRVLMDQQDKPERMVGVTIDITDRRREEEALRRSEKLAAAGRLAATIAHEINNPLEAVTNLLYLMRAGHDPEFLSMAEQEVARISHIVKQTLAFYRESPDPIALNPGDLIDRVAAVFRTKIRASLVTIETRHRSSGVIHGFANELLQVLGNLIGNAVDAVQPGGTLRIRTLDFLGGVRITVADNGRGISPEDLGKIFQPFFTANKEGGTGLGLWLAKEIVEKHGGSIRVRSSMDSRRHGTVFIVWLPASVSATVQAAAS